jgi:hypothetical protein
MVLGLTQPLTKMSIRDVSLGVKAAVSMAENLAILCVDYLKIFGAYLGLCRDIFTFNFDY